MLWERCGGALGGSDRFMRCQTPALSPSPPTSLPDRRFLHSGVVCTLPAHPGAAAALQVAAEYRNVLSET
eukprot:10584637-Prorocentrum_lima.AAC.1